MWKLENKEDCKKKIKRLKKLINALKYDSLTGFYTRTYFDKILYKKIKKELSLNKKSVFLLLIDMDNLKYFNDVYGYKKGDEYIKESAKIISEAVKDFKNYKIRLGGDEFLVILCLDEEDYPSLKEIVNKIKYKKGKKGLSVGYLFIPSSKVHYFNNLRFIMLRLHSFIKNEKEKKDFHYRKL